MSTPVKKLALKLPAAAKQGIMDGLGASLDKLTAIAAMVGEAEEDDAAVVPADLGMALRDCASVISGLADQYAAAPDASPEQTPPPAMVEGAAPPAQKNLPAPQMDPAPPAAMKDPLTLPTVHDISLAPKTMSAVGELQSALGAEFAQAAELAKAGRKISSARYKKMSELHAHLGSLLNELAYDEGTGAGEDAPAKKSLGAIAQEAKIDKLLQLAEMNQAKLAAHDAVIAKMQQPATPRSVPIESNGGAPPPTSWPMDLSADLEKRRKAAR